MADEPELTQKPKPPFFPPLKREDHLRMNALKYATHLVVNEKIGLDQLAGVAADMFKFLMPK